MIRVRQLEPEDGQAATHLWASAMKGSNYGESLQKNIDKFVDMKLKDHNDMGNVYLNYVQMQKELSNDDKVQGGINFESNLRNANILQRRNFWVVDYIELSPEKHSKKSEIVGCIGGIVRSGNDLSKATPEGKDYIARDNFEYPLWSKPLGIGLSPNIYHGGVELVRMAVHSDFRGKEKIFSVVDAKSAFESNEDQKVSVSQLLILSVAKWAVKMNCRYVVLTTGKSMYKAVGAYKRLGFSGHYLPENVAFSAEVSTLIDKNLPKNMYYENI